MKDPYEDWASADEYHARIRLEYIKHAGKISAQEEQRLKEMMKSPDRENYTIAELLIQIKDESESERTLPGQGDSETSSGTP